MSIGEGTLYDDFNVNVKVSGGMLSRLISRFHVNISIIKRTNFVDLVPT